jgi:DNA primase
MNEFSPTEFLHREVYPQLDAVEANLLDGLHPKPKTASGSYPLTCPACSAKEGFYYPFSGYINCPRKKDCGKSTSVWDGLLKCGYTQAEIFSTLCDAANVQPPKRDQGNTANNSTQNEVRIGKAVWIITQRMASDNAAELKRFQVERGYTAEQMAAMRLGFFSSPADLLTKLSAYGHSKTDAVERGYVEVDDKEELLPGLSGRIIGYWPHPDGDDRLWGRIPTGSGDKVIKKYKFALKLKKDIPYLFNQRKSSVLVCVEGNMDAWAMQLSDLWGCAVGGASINSKQALYLQNRGITELAHMVDGDTAGWNGAITSIRNCESLGIVTSIIALGAGKAQRCKSLLRNA